MNRYILIDLIAGIVAGFGFLAFLFGATDGGVVTIAIGLLILTNNLLHEER